MTMPRTQHVTTSTACESRKRRPRKDPQVDNITSRVTKLEETQHNLRVSIQSLQDEITLLRQQFRPNVLDKSPQYHEMATTTELPDKGCWEGQFFGEAYDSIHSFGPMGVDWGVASKDMGYLGSNSVIWTAEELLLSNERVN